MALHFHVTVNLNMVLRFNSRLCKCTEAFIQKVFGITACSLKSQQEPLSKQSEDKSPHFLHHKAHSPWQPTMEALEEHIYRVLKPIVQSSIKVKRMLRIGCEHMTKRYIDWFRTYFAIIGYLHSLNKNKINNIKTKIILIINLIY